MINFNRFTQGIYDAVPYTTICLPDDEGNRKLIQDFIDALPKSLISLTYVAQEDKGILNLIFNAPAQNIDAREITRAIYNQVPECGVDTYTQRVIGDHTFYTCEIPF